MKYPHRASLVRDEMRPFFSFDGKVWQLIRKVTMTRGDRRLLALLTIIVDSSSVSKQTRTPLEG